MSDGLGTAALIFAAVVVVIAGGMIWWVNRPQRARPDDESSHILPLFGSDPEAQQSIMRAATPPGGVGQQPTQPAAQQTPPRGAPQASYARPITPVGARAVGSTTATQTPPKTQVRTFTTPPVSAPSAPGTVRTTLVANAYAPGTMVDGQSVRFSIPDEGTLQFLPGRLEIVGGQDVGREIRFVRLPGPDGTEVTFGRADGELYRHVQLHDQTVSRSHARMRLADGRWSLTNLSTTNPVAHNGRMLNVGEELQLNEGDRVEMGAVIFRFRAR